MSPIPEAVNSAFTTPWTTPEQELIRQLQEGNEAAFHQFVRVYRPKVYGVACGIVGSRDDADDIAQQVFAKVHSAIRSFEGRSSLYTWVHRITVNECYGFLRKKRSFIFVEGRKGDDSLSVDMQKTPDPSPTSETRVIQRDFVHKLLSRVPAADRQLLLLHELEGYSAAQLAAATGINTNTIKTRLLRTRRKLLAAPTYWSFENSKRKN